MRKKEANPAFVHSTVDIIEYCTDIMEPFIIEEQKAKYMIWSPLGGIE